ncbi:TetR/AcrR family transcriptional regulator [Marinobacterium nitratireducens]|uniref:TetR/AcrR family transcriptional regulator n=1 Tax=Marinobacterium nitratireducens TaxID=518897 RepID=UPI00166E9DEE|nr:TetR/AcrR family transcriptional regulator [Marinobacterium nitratireducens]
MRRQTDTREKLLCTAMELIWQSNYTSVGVNEICKQAGVTKGSFYHYFDTKADLYYAAVLHHWAQIKEDLDRNFDPARSALQQLYGYIDMVVDHARGKDPVAHEGGGRLALGCPVFTSGGQCGCEEDKVQQAAREMAANKIAYETAMVARLKAEGLLNGDPDPDQVGRMLYQYIQGLLIYCRIYNDIDSLLTDLHEGVYRLLDLRAEYRRATDSGSSSAA